MAELTGLAKKYDHLVTIKEEMAKKYQRKSALTASQPQRIRMASRAARLSRQAKEYARKRDQQIAAEAS